MRLKLLFSLLTLSTLILTSLSLVAQERERPAAARSLSADRFSWPIAEIDAMREASKETFELLDANSSGSITLDEIDIIPELIEGEEVLPTEELAKLRQRSNIVSRTFMYIEEDMDHFDVADSDNDGSLSKTEFDLRETTLRTHILQLNIESFDKDKNGGVEFSEFSAHLDNIEELDSDGDGSLSRAELGESSDTRLLHDIRVSQWQRQVRLERRAQQSQLDERNRANNR